MRRRPRPAAISLVLPRNVINCSIFHPSRIVLLVIVCLLSYNIFSATGTSIETHSLMPRDTAYDAFVSFTGDVED
ncbi:hypothetical protein NUW54_g1274 [Trametes sanguinea]|uniref:Uncharacterized protein n=1 Tax=Trametes sanguinea TaxID=158606 RepID=A0ACC1Q6T1_9APHY|nr:hypothetical protein NUW54_g1274 [Trametes sanguinea]